MKMGERVLVRNSGLKSLPDGIYQVGARPGLMTPREESRAYRWMRERACDEMGLQPAEFDRRVRELMEEEKR